MNVDISKLKKQITKEDLLNFVNINGYNIEDKIKEEEKGLKEVYSSHQISEEEFYENEMLDYAEEVSKLILKDYGSILDDETKEKINNFINTKESVVFIDKNDFPEVSKDGKKVSAFAKNKEGKVYFPLYDRNENDDIITFVRKQKQNLIHEMFHIVTKNNSEKQDFFYNGEYVGEYKPGHLFNEAIAEKSARDFATRNKLIYHPMLSYMPYAKSLEMFMNKYGIQDNSQMFNINFQDIIKFATFEEQQEYYDFEKEYNLSRYGINSSNYIQSQESQLASPKNRVRTLNKNIVPNNNGFASIISLLAVSLIVVIVSIFAYLLI